MGVRAGLNYRGDVCRFPGAVSRNATDGGYSLSKENFSPGLRCSNDSSRESSALPLGLEGEASWMVPRGSHYYSLRPGLGECLWRTS